MDRAFKRGIDRGGIDDIRAEVVVVVDPAQDHVGQIFAHQDVECEFYAIARRSR